jgi:hypothetical protein
MIPEVHGGNSELTGPTGQAYLLDAETKKRVCGGCRWNTRDLSAYHSTQATLQSRGSRQSNWAHVGRCRQCAPVQYQTLAV